MVAVVSSFYDDPNKRPFKIIILNYYCVFSFLPLFLNSAKKKKSVSRRKHVPAEHVLSGRKYRDPIDSHKLKQLYNISRI